MNKFNKKAISSLKAIISSRRDIRGNRFLNKKIDDKILNELLEAANNAPSVGFSQPWKFIIVKDNKKREKVYKNFQKENKKAKEIFKTNEIYPNLKLEGIKESYINIAVLYKKPKKDILGQTTQKKVGEYSVVCAIQNFWLMARAYGIGVGWVSILKAKKIKKILGINDDYKLIAYLTVGYVKEFLDEPELKKIGWEKKKTLNDITKL
ncbi:MAG: 5,6-dimethylbenzimidazole synthase [Campylobacteraceae bacterium]|nr:5,6-dimethylbenzimidazole synthase [Campylobacteraceae bacterium]